MCASLVVSEYCTIQCENRPEGKLKVYVAGRGGIHSLDDDSI